MPIDGRAICLTAPGHFVRVLTRVRCTWKISRPRALYQAANVFTELVEQVHLFEPFGRSSMSSASRRPRAIDRDRCRPSRYVVLRAGNRIRPFSICSIILSVVCIAQGRAANHERRNGSRRSREARRVVGPATREKYRSRQFDGLSMRIVNRKLVIQRLRVKRTAAGATRLRRRSEEIGRAVIWEESCLHTRSEKRRESAVPPPRPTSNARQPLLSSP